MYLLAEGRRALGVLKALVHVCCFNQEVSAARLARSGSLLRLLSEVAISQMPRSHIPSPPAQRCFSQKPKVRNIFQEIEPLSGAGDGRGKTGKEGKRSLGKDGAARCTLDFYVHEKRLSYYLTTALAPRPSALSAGSRCQRAGFGHQLFNVMLQREEISPVWISRNITPSRCTCSISQPLRHLEASVRTLCPFSKEKMGYDRPSPKFLAFLRKHYGLCKHKVHNHSRRRCKTYLSVEASFQRFQCFPVSAPKQQLCGLRCLLG